MLAPRPPIHPQPTALSHPKSAMKSTDSPKKQNPVKKNHEIFCQLEIFFCRADASNVRAERGERRRAQAAAGRHINFLSLY